jgi:LCP family protein required for cell wall assembly
MTPPAHACRDSTARPPAGPARHRLRHRSGHHWTLIGFRVLGALAALLILIVTGLGWAGYRHVSSSITTSQALAGGPASTGGVQNILIMGLDSRLDQHGQPLPRDIYDALHAGDENVGGYNANVLIVLHLPAGGGAATAFSIPRDDYVDLSACPTDGCKGKIKQAYGLAYEHVLDPLGKWQSGETQPDITAAQEQAGREAGRKAQISTVRHLLGIPIDHFIEVTLVAFLEIAKVVEPITVCLNGDTSDSYSGANFHQGVQQISAAEAMAFVRQRRDANDELFTDLDRTRRQQAFIASLVTALRTGGALDSPSALGNLLEVANQNVAVDAGFDLAGFVRHPPSLTGTPLSLYTLPIAEFGQDPAGEDVNIIDVPTIRGIVHNLVGAGSPTTTASTSGAGAATAAGNDPQAKVTGGPVLNVINASHHDGLAAVVEKTFATRGFTAGAATSADTISDVSTVRYGPGADNAAHGLADQFDLTATASDTVTPNTVQLTIGSDFPAGDYLTGSSSTESTTTSPTTPVPTVAATATGTRAPAPTDLTHMTAAGVPCVK